MYDLVIIGAGPAGMAASHKAVDRGLKVCLIEQGSIGGVCLNRGCMPTKFYIHRLHQPETLEGLYEHKGKLISRLSTAAEKTLSSRGIRIVKGRASFVSSSCVTVNQEQIESRNFLIASGSSPRRFSFLSGTNIVDPETFLLEPVTGDDFLIVGAGVIGIEYAFMLSLAGKKVTLVEKENRILPGFDIDVVQKITQLLKKRKIKLMLSHDIREMKPDEYSKVIVAAGRVPSVIDGLDRTGVEVTDDGWIKTDKYLRTSVPEIFACGDVRGAYLYAYAAEREGEIAVDNISGVQREFNPQLMPACVFAAPQAAMVGSTQSELDAGGIKYKLFLKQNIALSSSHVYEDKDGFFKVLIGEDGRVLGAHIVSNNAVDLIGYYAICIAHGITFDSLCETYFIHPSMSEMITGVFR